MNAEFETVKYVPAGKIKKSISKYGLEIKRDAKMVIDSADNEDVLEVLLTINSPLEVVKAVNITKSPDKLFAVVE